MNWRMTGILGMIRFLAAATCCLGLADVLSAESSARLQPNILFFFSDDQRSDTIHALGNPHIHTPNLDRLAASGVAMTRAYVMGAMQGAVCMPSRAMLMSGQSLFRVRENLVGTVTWPEQFARAGYRTFMTGKWHNGPKSAGTTFQEGRNVFFGGMSDAHGMPVQDFSEGQTPGPKRTSAEHHTELFAGTAIEFLENHPKGQPFLCYVSFKSPHDPRTATASWDEYYQKHPPPLPANVAPMHLFDNGDMVLRDEKLLPWPRTKEALAKEFADYYACISHVDEQVGRVLEVLRRRGLETNTLIVYAGDNGLAIGSHGLLGKQNLYEHSVGVPLLFAGPGVPRNRRSEAFCYLFDIFPTLAELAGIPPLGSSEGHSLVPIFRADDSAPVRTALFTAYRQCQRAVRDDRWKLIRYPLIDKTQLFDLRNDPFEQKDLAGEAASSQKVKEMLGLLRQQQLFYGDTAPLTVENPAPAAWFPPSAAAQPDSNRTKADKKKNRG